MDVYIIQLSAFHFRQVAAEAAGPLPFLSVLLLLVVQGTSQCVPLPLSTFL